MHQQIRILNIKQLTIPGFFYFSYLFIIFIPSFFVYFDNPGVPGDRFIFSTVGVLVFFPAGVFMANLFLRFKAREIGSYYLRPIASVGSFSGIEKAAWLFLGIGAAIVGMYLIEVLPAIGGIPPIIKLLSGGESYINLILLREDSLKLLDSPIKYFYILLKDFYFPFIVVLTFAIQLVYRRRESRRLFLIALSISLFYASFTLAKSPVAIIFFLLILCYYVFKKGGIQKKYFLFIPIIILVFPIIVTLMFYGAAGNEKGIFDAITGLSKRIFFVPVNGAYNLFEIFPFERDFVYGRSVGKLSLLLGREPLDMNEILVSHAFKSGPRLESLNMSGGFIGVFNADFGIPGVILLTILTGLLLQLLQIYFLRRKKTIQRFSAYIYIMYSTIFINLTSVPNTMLQHGLILALIFPGVFSLTTQFLCALGVKRDPGRFFPTQAQRSYAGKETL